jgi:hypothetical protein
LADHRIACAILRLPNTRDPGQDPLDRELMQARRYASARVAGDHHVVIKIKRSARRRLDAEIRRHAADHHGVTPSTTELEIQLGTEKRAHLSLGDTYGGGQRIHLGHQRCELRRQAVLR